MARLMQQLSDLDDRALNAWWGVLVVPFVWVGYRAGYRWRDNRRAQALLGNGWDPMVERGRVEGRPLKKR